MRVGPITDVSSGGSEPEINHPPVTPLFEWIAMLLLTGGGNVFVMGGRVNGSRIHGVYPDSMKGNSLYCMRGGQGRVIPTMGWEGVWKPLAQWLGVEDARMSEIMPNHDRFPDEQLITKEQVFA